MFRSVISIAATVALWTVSGSATANEPLTLRFAIPGASPMSSTYTKVFQPWIARVDADGEGSVKVQEFFNIANFGNVYDRVVNAVADIGYTGMGAAGGKFPLANVVQLPSDISSSKIAAGAFWKLYEDGLIASEFSEVRPLAFFIFPQNMLSSPRPVTTLADVKGLRVAVLSKGGGDIVERLGGAPISTTPSSFYEVLQRRTVDAAIIGWNGLMTFKLTEVSTNHIAFGLDSGGAAVLMNKDVYAKLPAKAKQAIDKNSGLATSQTIGAAWDTLYADAQEAVRKMPGQTIVSLKPQDQERYMRDVVAPLTEEWIKKTPNGAAILAAYRAEVAKLRQAR
jgi:TRAP-type C4-dicarboxylate transport system substrate-binding protein